MNLKELYWSATIGDADHFCQFADSWIVDIRIAGQG